MDHLNSIIPTSLNLNFSPFTIGLNSTNYETWKSQTYMFQDCVGLHSKTFECTNNLTLKCYKQPMNEL
jgi:hypothetical protein